MALHTLAASQIPLWCHVPSIDVARSVRNGVSTAMKFRASSNMKSLQGHMKDAHRSLCRDYVLGPIEVLKKAPMSFWSTGSMGRSLCQPGQVGFHRERRLGGGTVGAY